MTHHSDHIGPTHASCRIHTSRQLRALPLKLQCCTVQRTDETDTWTTRTCQTRSCSHFLRAFQAPSTGLGLVQTTRSVGSTCRQHHRNAHISTNSRQAAILESLAPKNRTAQAKRADAVCSHLYCTILSPSFFFFLCL